MADTIFTYGGRIPTYGGGQRIPYFDIQPQFQPSDISGLNLWLTINDQSTINGGSGVIDGGTVSSWLDKSSNAFEFTQATDSLRPVYTEATKKLSFDGDSLKVSTPQALNNTSGSIYFSFYFNNRGNDQVIFASGDESSTGYIIVGVRTNSSLNKLEIQSIINGVVYANTTTLVNGTYYYAYISSNGTSVSMRVNGVDQVSYTGTNNGAWFGDVADRDNLSVGRMFRSTEFDGGGLAEVNKICYFNRVLTADEITQMDNYMSDSDN